VTRGFYVGQYEKKSGKSKLGVDIQGLNGVKLENVRFNGKLVDKL
jgi:hypothetical protein